MRRATALLTAIALAVPPAVAGAQARGTAASDTPIYLDRAYPAAERAADLVSRMTLAEKASQMVSSMSAAIPRLGVAAYGWWNEAGHGVAREQTRNAGGPPTLTNTTSYPVDLSLGSTWNPDLIYNEATAISDEARDVVRDNALDLTFYSPTINLARDPRWGRNDEAFSEDPLLAGALAAQWVNGMQGQTEQGSPLPGSAGYLKAIATVKHFAANNSEYNRVNGSSDMDERTLREYYTAQFRDVVKWSHPGSIMSAYNSVNGVPAPANVHLIDTLARQTFGFDGYFTSDCDAVYEMQHGHNWQPSGAPAPLDQYGRTAYAQSAGEDLNCDYGYHDSWNYANTIPTAVADAITTSTDVYNENDVDVSLVRLFTARMELGEFDAEDQVPWVAAARSGWRPAPGPTPTPTTRSPKPRSGWTSPARWPVNMGSPPDRVAAQTGRLLARPASVFDVLDAEALATIGIDLRAVRDAVEASFGPGAVPSSRVRRQGRVRLPGHLAVTGRARACLTAATQEPDRSGAARIGVRHLGAAVVAADRGLVPPILAALGVSAPTLRTAILERAR